MWFRQLVRVSVALALALTALLPASSVAFASCAIAQPLDQRLAQADVVFVGTVTSVDQTGRLATVQVEEIWRGPDLPSVVEVRGAVDGTAFTSVDRRFEQSMRYLFAPMTDGNLLIDHACSPTQPYGVEATAYRPANIRGPIGGVPAPQSIGPATLVVAGTALAAIAGLIALGSLTLVRRRAASWAELLDEPTTWH